jgi:dihydrofolate synthase/folylpolyglutamate synthase
VHQIGNAGMAVACAERLSAAGFAIGHAAMAWGLMEVEWPARLQRLTQGPFVAPVPPGAEVWLDGGHNPAAGEALAATFRAWRAADSSPRPLYMLAGMLKTKDASGFFAPLAGVVDWVAAAAIPAEANSLGANELAAAAVEAGLNAAPVASPEAGMAALARRAGTTGKSARFLIAGSLYLAGHVLARGAATAANTRRIQDR